MWGFPFNMFPGINMHDIDLDWILKTMRDLWTRMDNFTSDISSKIVETVNDWLDDHPEATTTVEDGSLTYSKFAEDTLQWVTPEMFGAAGDGVTDDTIALQNALDNGNVILKGTYFVTADLTVNGKILGKDGTIILYGCQIIYGNTCSIDGVTIIARNNVTTCIRFNNSVYCDVLDIKDCVFTSTLSTDTSRQNIGIRARGKTVNIENISFNGFISGVIYEPYLNVENGPVNLDNITGHNIQTLVDIEGQANNVVVSPVVRNIKLINSVTQKNSIMTEVGSDAVLVDYCSDFTIENVIAINPRERAVYANHVRDGFVTDVYCYGSQVIKVCGTADYFAERVKISNIHGDEIGYNGYLFTTYYANDLDVSNLSEHTSSDLDNVPMIRIQNACSNISIDGFLLDGATRGAIALDKTDLNTTMNNIIIRNGVIKRCNLRVQNYAIMLTDTSSQGTVWINGLIVDNVALNPDSVIIGYTNGLINLANVSNIVLKDNLIRGVVASSLLTLGISKGSNVSSLKLIGTFPVATRDSFTTMTFTQDSNVVTQSHGGEDNFDGRINSDGTSNVAIVEGSIALTGTLKQVLDSGEVSYPYIEVSGKGGTGKWSLINNVVTPIEASTVITLDRYGRISTTESGTYYIKFIRN